MTTVCTYPDLTRLKDSKIYSSLSSLPHIAASAALRDEIANCLNPQCKILSFRDLLHSVAPGWRSQIDRARRRDRVNEYFRARMRDATADEREFLSRCLKRKNDFLDAIILLTESDIGPDDIDPNSPEATLLVEIWKFLIEKNDSVCSINHKIDDLAKPGPDGRPRMCNVVDSAFNTQNANKVVLLGFYYITPIQKHVFDIMESCSIELIFLVNYDWSYPYAYEIWERTFSPEFGFPDKSEWIRDGGSSKQSPIGDLFEMRKTQAASVRIRKQKTTLELARDAKDSIERGECLLSSDQRSANDILYNFFPDMFGQMPLVTYPIGRFLTTVYSMWDEESSTLKLDMDSLKICFSTGWLRCGDHDSSEYMTDLEMIEGYFEDCSTVGEWEDRLDYLDGVWNDVLSHFDTGSTDRWERMMSSPFSNLSIFSADRQRLTDVTSMIHQLLDIAKRLFQNGTSIHEHIQQIETYLDENDSSSRHKTEHELLSETLKQIDENAGDITMSVSGMRDAMTAFIQEGQEVVDPDEKGLVQPLREYGPRVASNGIHIILCDIERMPGRRSDFQWPVSRGLIERTMSKCSGRKKTLLADLLHVSDSTPLSNRYLFTSLLKCDAVTISWVETIDGKTVQPSPYLTLLQKMCNLDIETRSSANMDLGRVRACTTASLDMGPSENILGPSLPTEVKMDYALCPMRYLYGYVLEDHPSYSSEFHTSYVISRMISVFRTVCPEYDKETITQSVVELFPNIINVKKRQAVDYTATIEDTGTTTFNGRVYRNVRYNLCFPDKSLLRMANDRLKKMESGRIRNIDVTISNDAKVCKFCQHERYCRRAKFWIDERKHQ